MQFTEDQQIKILEARSEWNSIQATIDDNKADQKTILDNLFTSLGFDKENKEEKKAISKGFKIHYKQNQVEEKNVADGAIEVAEL